MKRHIITILILALGFFTLESCKKCKNEDPSARIINNGNIKCSVQIQTSGGNTVNVNNVMPGTSSDYASYAPGIVTFTVSVGSDNYVETVEMFQCYNYDIILDASNNVSAVAYDLNE